MGIQIQNFKNPKPGNEDQRKGQMPDREDQRVFKGIFDLVHELCLQGEYVHEDQQVNGSGQKSGWHQDIVHQEAPHADLHKEADVQVKEKKRAEEKHDQPDNGALAEVFPEGSEEVSGDIGFVAVYHLHGRVKHGGCGCADGEDGNAAHHPEHVQYDQVGDTV